MMRLEIMNNEQLGRCLWIILRYFGLRLWPKHAEMLAAQNVAILILLHGWWALSAWCLWSAEQLRMAQQGFSKDATNTVLFAFLFACRSEASNGSFHALICVVAQGSQVVESPSFVGDALQNVGEPFYSRWNKPLGETLVKKRIR